LKFSAQLHAAMTQRCIKSWAYVVRRILLPDSAGTMRASSAYQNETNIADSCRAPLAERERFFPEHEFLDFSLFRAIEHGGLSGNSG
jgi:hypothetical protein